MYGNLNGQWRRFMAQKVKYFVTLRENIDHK